MPLHLGGLAPDFNRRPHRSYVEMRVAILRAVRLESSPTRVMRRANLSWKLLVRLLPAMVARGLISLPSVLRYGYERRVAAGGIAASGTLAQIIPPSLVLIVLADQLGRKPGGDHVLLRSPEGRP